MRFLPRQEVEISSKEEGFICSLYAATIITHFVDNLYLVEYKNLLKDDESGPLREVIPEDQIRPLPPAISFSLAGFTVLDKVDAYYNDGWWTGKITGTEGTKYVVHFESSGEKLTFSPSDLRMHLEWINGNWIAIKRRVLFLNKETKDNQVP